MHDEWLWGWDDTSGIVSVWAEWDGRAYVWRRLPDTRELVRQDVRFRPWLLLASLDDLAHQGRRLAPESASAGGATPAGAITYRELDGPGALRFLVQADDGRALRRAVLQGASRRLGRARTSLRELGQAGVLALPPEEQYLVASGCTHFRELDFDALSRLQFDLETTGLDPEHDRVFMIALSHQPASRPGEGDRSHPSEVLEADGEGDEAEVDLLRRLAARVHALDPDVIENHNLHGFDLPFIVRRCELLGVRLVFGRLPGVGFRERPAARGVTAELPGGLVPEVAIRQSEAAGNTTFAWGAASAAAPAAQTEAGPDALPQLVRRFRYCVPGRELIDTLDAVRRYDFASRELPGHGLKAVARHLGIAHAEREYIAGPRVYATYRSDPERVRRYACDDVHEAAGVARLLGGAAFALARMVPRRYERLADAGPATGVLDPLLVRAYLRAGAALPEHASGDGTEHSGAALYLFATGVARRIVKADVASLYPSLMREYRIGPARDRLGALLSIVERLVDQRLDAKAAARAAVRGSAEHHTQEALSAAMKIVVNSAYGYLGAIGLTRFADVRAANEVTRHGRELLARICRELAGRGVTLLEADTDGVYFAVPDQFTEQDERRVVAEVAALLPARVALEFEGRYAAMLSHEPKNYALAPYAGPLVLRGVAFRSSRAEPFGEAFLRRAIASLLAGDVRAVQGAYIDSVLALRRRQLPTRDVSARVRLTKTPEQYRQTRAQRRELTYEALLANGRESWRVGERIRVYRATGGRAGILPDEEGLDAGASADARDYDVEYYLRVLRDTFAARLARALDPEDYAHVFGDPEQPSLFASSLEDATPILTRLAHTAWQ
jgi:DNA polymerase, archaea type